MKKKSSNKSIQVTGPERKGLLEKQRGLLTSILMNLLVKFVSSYIDYFGQNLATAHLPQEHNAGHS